MLAASFRNYNADSKEMKETRASKANGIPRNQSYTCVQEPFVTKQGAVAKTNSSNCTVKHSILRKCEDSLGEKIKFSNVVGNILEKLCEAASFNSISEKEAIFHGAVPPKINLSNYCFRILKYGRIDCCVLTCAIVYIDTLVRKKVVTLSEFSVHRLLLAACVVAAKVVDDKHLTNKNFSLVGGVSLEELNQLELAICLLMNFKMNVPLNVFQKYTETIEALL